MQEGRVLVQPEMPQQLNIVPHELRGGFGRLRLHLAEGHLLVALVAARPPLACGTFSWVVTARERRQHRCSAPRKSSLQGREFSAVENPHRVDDSDVVTGDDGKGASDVQVAPDDTPHDD